MEKSKGETYIGFALRARKCKIGANACATLKKAKLIVACKSATENSIKDAEKLSARFKCPLLITKSKTLAEITHKENAKIMAITDDALSRAVLAVKEEFTEKV